MTDPTDPNQNRTPQNAAENTAILGVAPHTSPNASEGRAHPVLWTKQGALFFAAAAVVLFMSLSVVANYLSNLLLRVIETVLPTVANTLFDGAPQLLTLMPTMLILYAMLAVVFWQSRALHMAFGNEHWFSRPSGGWSEIVPSVILAMITMAIVNFAHISLLETGSSDPVVIDDTVVTMRQLHANVPQAGLLMLVMVLGAPIIEEVLFRGMIFKALDKAMGFWPSALLSAALFSAVHLKLSTLFPLFCFGLIAAYLVKSTKSLWPPIAFHITNNALIVGFALQEGWGG